MFLNVGVRFSNLRACKRARAWAQTGSHLAHAHATLASQTHPLRKSRIGIDSPRTGAPGNGQTAAFGVWLQRQLVSSEPRATYIECELTPNKAGAWVGRRFPPSMISNFATVSLSLKALGPLPVPATRATAHQTGRNGTAGTSLKGPILRETRGGPVQHSIPQMAEEQKGQRGRGAEGQRQRAEGTDQRAAGLSRRMMATSMFLILIRTSRKKILPWTTSRKWYRDLLYSNSMCRQSSMPTCPDARGAELSAL